MYIKTLVIGQLQTNCYVVTDERTLECAVIDPAGSSPVLDYVESNKLKVKAILLTHGHFDHTTGAESLKEETGADLYIHRLDCAESRSDGYMKYVPPKDIKHYAEGDEITVSGLVFKVMETPGHTPGSVTLMCEDALFTGDTLFRDSCGRTDLGGNMGQMLKSLKRLYELEGDFEVYPGHADYTSLSRERSENYYMQRAIEEE